MTDDEKIPPSYDFSWPARCEPLLDFLEEPRDWKALEAWARREKVKQEMLRNMLAWLEDRWLAREDPETRTWRSPQCVVDRRRASKTTRRRRRRR